MEYITEGAQILNINDIRIPEYNNKKKSIQLFSKYLEVYKIGTLS